MQSIFEAWLAQHAALRTAETALVGLLLGALVNWAVSSLAYEPRFLSPWSRQHPRDGLSSWHDRVPLFGWWRLRRKSNLLGSAFWVRPLLVELGMTFGCATLYAWEVLDGGLLPPGFPPLRLHDPLIVYPLHFGYLAHVLLLTFMAAASLIDFDELNIPDAVTVPGTLLGITLTTAFPWAFLPAGFDLERQLVSLYSIYPFANPIPLQASPNLASLAIAVGCYWLWCGGLLYRPWRTSRGYRTAVRLLLGRMRRDRATPWIALLAVLGSAAITAVWLYEPERWIGLGTSLLGVAAGGLVVWVTRVIGTWALGREAMGFGDVTLLAMIGAYVGWQPAVMVFFAAPATALMFGTLQWIATRNTAFCYGPFLCLATVGIVACWSQVWQWAEPRFATGWLIPGVLAVGFVMLWLTLAVLRAVRMRRG